MRALLTFLMLSAACAPRAAGDADVVLPEPEKKPDDERPSAVVDPDDVPGTGFGECDGVGLRASADTLRRPNFPDFRAELLAIEARDAFVADHADAERIQKDLVRVRAQFPTQTPFDYLPLWWQDSSLLVRLTPAAVADFKAGRFTAWNCLNAHYGATIDTEFLAFINTVTLHFPARLNANRLAFDYRKLQGIDDVTVNQPLRDGPDVCAEFSGQTRFYVVDTSSDSSTICDAAGTCTVVESCSGGCLVHDYTLFRAEGEQVVKVATLHTQRASDLFPSDPEPAWWNERWNCVQWLHINRLRAARSANGRVPPTR